MFHEGTFKHACFSSMQDIAILTNNVTNCVYYQEESANVKSRHACVLPTATIQANVNNKGNNYVIPNNEAECQVSLLPSLQLCVV